MHTENRTSLSTSQLWQRQREFYQQQGIKAWQTTVPFYATSNPNIANAYANIIINFIREVRQSAHTEHAHSPVYIVELAAGSGTFSFYLLKRLHDLAQQLYLPKNAFIYVMTDLVEDNINFWHQQESLQDFVAKGILDFARFDLENDNDIILNYSQKSLTKSVLFPTVFIANYIFDTLTQDIFKISKGNLNEGLIKTNPEIKEFLPNQGCLLTDIEGGITYQPATWPYYQDTAIDAVIARYQTDYPDLELVFPIGSLRAIKKLQTISNNRLLLLATDKAYSHHFEQLETAPIDLVFHGKCFSMTANFHAIGRYFEAIGGDYSHQDTQQSSERPVNPSLQNYCA